MPYDVVTEEITVGKKVKTKTKIVYSRSGVVTVTTS